MQEKIFDNRINDFKGVKFNRVQIFKIAKRGCLSVAAEILFDVRARIGEFNLAVLARQAKKNRDK